MGLRFARSAAGTVAILGALFATLCVHGLRVAEASFGEMLDSYGLTNLVIGASLMVTGTMLASARPGIAIGWLLQSAGTCYLLSAAALALLPLPGREAPVLAGIPPRVAGALYYASWPPAIGLLIPLALLAFPEGRLRGRVNLAIASLIGLTGVAFWAAFGLFPGDAELPNGVGLPVPLYADLQPLWDAANIANLVAWLTVCAVLIARYFRGDETTKRRMLWLILPILAAIAITVPFSVFGLGGVGFLAAFVLIPTGVLIGVLRYQLLDIRLAVARTLVWLLLVGLVLALDLLLVNLLAPLVLPEGWSTAIAALLVALAAEPLRRLLQRGIDRLVFGRLGTAEVTRLLRERIAGAEDSAALVESLRRALGVAGLRYEVIGIGVIAESGRVDKHVERVDLIVGGQTLGALHVGVRRGDTGLRQADRSLLAVAEPALGILAQSLRLSAALGESRSRILEAAEVERRRLQRDLHDGVASALTGVQFKLEAARASTLGDSSGGGALDDASEDLRHVLASLRLVIDDLRPPELDRLGLAAALRTRWVRAVGRKGTAVVVRVDAEMPETLPAAVESSAYRIAVEATTNALRHTSASTICITLRLDGAALTLRVDDDGGPPRAWQEGTGMGSMRERAEQLGGRCLITSTETGMTVDAYLPFPTHFVESPAADAVHTHA